MSRFTILVQVDDELYVALMMDCASVESARIAADQLLASFACDEVEQHGLVFRVKVTDPACRIVYTTLSRCLEWPQEGSCRPG